MSLAARWRQVDGLFATCLELDEAGREAFLDQACGDDAALRSEVCELLALDRAPLPGLEALAWGDSWESAAERMPRGAALAGGLRFGPYEIVEAIGEGGMGRVYRARRSDGRYERDVAIKILKEGLLDRESLGRFRNECRALAQLEHEGIARLYDAGRTREGLPYLVMEYIEGVRLDHFARRPGLDLGERLELFRHICDAVSHAHGQLIVHRDLKPGNILVTARLRPKLLDFGIAKILDDDGVVDWTRGPSPMTPRYASPEQKAGQPITTATDVYALGLLCGELIAGPADAGPAAESAVAGLAVVPADLRAIVGKATAESPADRYPSAEQLSAEIGRFLGGLPVLARSPTLSYRLRRFVRRHRLAVAALTSVFAVVLLAATGFARLAHEVSLQRDRARIEARISGQVTDFMVDLFARTEPGQRGPREPTASEMLRRGLTEVEKAFDRSPGDRPVRAALLTAIGRAYQSLSLYDDAAAASSRALELQRSASSAGDARLMAALLRVAEIERLRSNFERAESLAREALATSAPATPPSSPVANPLRAKACRLLGLVLTQRGDLVAAERWLQEALAIDQRLGTGGDLAVGLDQRALATLAFERRDSAAAERWSSAALRALDAALGPEHPTVLSVLNEVTIARQNLGDLDNAVAAYQELLARQRRVFGDRHEVIAATLNGLGTTYYELGELPAAEQYFRRSVEMLHALGNRSTLVGAEVAKNLARTLWEAGYSEEAIALYREVLTVQRQKLEASSPSLGAPLTFLGGALCSQGEVEEGEVLLDEAREIYLDALGADHYRLALLQGTRSKCAQSRGQLGAARDHLEAARVKVIAHFGADHHVVDKIRARLVEIEAAAVARESPP